MAKQNPRNKRQFLIHLLDEEMRILDEKADKYSMSKSCFIRDMILFNAVQRNGYEHFDRETADKLRYEINRIGNNINQIIYQAHNKLEADENDFSSIVEFYRNLLAHFDDWVIA